MLVGDNAESMANRRAAQIREALREHGCAADTVAGSYVLDGIFRTRLSNPSGRAHFAMELMAKDHRLMDALARKQGIELPMNRRALELCEEMCEAGYARRDNVASVEYFRKRNGLA